MVNYVSHSFIHLFIHLWKQKISKKISKFLFGLQLQKTYWLATFAIYFETGKQRTTTMWIWTERPPNPFPANTCKKRKYNNASFV